MSDAALEAEDHKTVERMTDAFIEAYYRQPTPQDAEDWQEAVRESMYAALHASRTA